MGSPCTPARRARTPPPPKDGGGPGSFGRCVLPCEAALIRKPILKLLSTFSRRDVEAPLMGGAGVHPETALIAAIQETLAASRPKR